MIWRTREQWQAKPPKYRNTNVTFKGVALHWPGADHDLRHRSVDYLDEYVRGIQHHHQTMLGHADIDYGVLVAPTLGITFEGRIEQDRPDVRAASNGTYDTNTSHTSICVLLGTAEGITSAEKRYIAESVAWLWSQGWGRDLVGHRDLISTSCPGEAIYRAIGDIKRMAIEISEGDDMPSPEEIAKAVWMYEIDSAGPDDTMPARWHLRRSGRIARRWLGPGGNAPEVTRQAEIHQRLKRVEEMVESLVAASGKPVVSYTAPLPSTGTWDEPDEGDDDE